MGNSAIVRTGRISDIPELVKLLEELFSIEEDFQFDRAKQEAGLRMILESGPDEKVLFVAELEEKIIGMCSAQALISTAEGAKSAMVEDMVVKDGFRGAGIGNLIMNEIVSWAKKKNIARLQLLADKNNSKAISFYKKNDWESTRLTCLKRQVV